MGAATLHDLNQRYVRLTDRCRSQWTFYQLLQGLFKHLRGAACPVELDYQSMFARLRDVGVEVGHPETHKSEKAIGQLNAELDKHAHALIGVDAEMSPSLLRRFFDRLPQHDEKVLLAIVKFYLETGVDSPDILDKLDLLFTRLAEIPRPEGGSLVRERHEIERLVHPLLQIHPLPNVPDNEIDILLSAIADLRAEALSCRRFSELVAGGAVDRFRTLKRRLGDTLLHPRLLPAVLETTIAIKNRFRELWEDEEVQILSDTNRALEIKRQLDAQPDMVSPELQEALSSFSSARERFDQARQEDNLRREDIVELRRSLKSFLEQLDVTHPVAAVAAHAERAEWPAGPLAAEPGQPRTDVDVESQLDEFTSVDEESPEESRAVPIDSNLPFDPLLSEYLSKIAFAIELVGRDRPAHEIVHARELVTLRIEPWEVEACRRVMEGRPENGRDATLVGERDRLLFYAAALRVRLDEEAREIDRLFKRSSEHLADRLERATQTLQRASEMERRFQWVIDDALYRGDTELLEPLFRSRFRLLRAYSGLWLIHNERGGTSPF